MITSMRRCVACHDLWPWPISSRSFNLVLTWGIQHNSIVWVIMRRQGVSSERRRSSCSSLFYQHLNSVVISDCKKQRNWAVLDPPPDMSLYTWSVTRCHVSVSVILKEMSSNNTKAFNATESKKQTCLPLSQAVCLLPSYQWVSARRM